MSPEVAALATAALLILYQGLALIPFHFGGSLGERDGYRMLLGLLDCLQRGVWFDSALLYNRQVSFGYFALLHTLAPGSGASAAAVIALMDWVSLAAAVLFVVPFFFVVDRLFGRAEAVIASLLLPAVPVWWQVSRYGHPITPALLLFFGGLALAATGRALWTLGAAALFAAALAFRFDVVLLFPLIACVARPAGAGWRRPVAFAAAYTALAVAVFLAAQAALPPIRGAAAPEGVLELLRRYEDPGRLREFLRLDCTMVGEAFGAAFLAAMPAAILLLRRTRRALRPLLFVAYPAAVNLVFWMPNPNPPRHYILLAPAAAVCGAVVLRFALERLRLTRPAWWWGAGLAGAAAAVLLSVAIQWGPIGRLPEVRSLFGDYRALARRQAAWSRLGAQLVALPPLGRPALVLCDAYYVAGRMELLRPGARAQLDEQPVQGQRLQFLTVREGGNTFVMLVQSWEPAEVQALDAARLFPDSVLIVDPYNPDIHYQGSRPRLDVAADFASARR